MDFIINMAVEYGWQNMLMDSDSSEEEDGRENLAKVENYVEHTVWNYTGRHFFIHFRMNQRTFDSLLNKLTAVRPQVLRGGKQETPLRKQLLMSIWYMANLESFRSVADRFGLSTYTPWACFNKVCYRLLELNEREKIIVWPNAEKCETISEAFQRRQGFPGIIGAIDGSQIAIKVPSRNSNSYINRKGFHSVLLQAVCDHNYNFIDCYAGEAGSIHDACMFRRSNLRQNINNLEFLNDCHLLGDSAYPLLKNLLVPFKDNGHLNPIQLNYNNIHSKCRVVIEQTFALLKGRFRRLKLLENTKIELIPLIIITACLLHNICRSFDDNEALVNIEIEVEEERIMNSYPEPYQNRNENYIEAVAKRNRIANTLYRQPL